MTDRFLSLIGPIYDAALDPSKWDATLAQVVAAFSGTGFSFLDKNFRNNSNSIHIQYGICEEMQRIYFEHYFKDDLRIEAVLRWPSGTIVHEPMFISETEMDRHEYYQDFLRPFDVRYFMGTALMNSDDTVAGITLLRSPHLGPPDVESVHRLQSLAPHFRRALLVQRRLHGLQAREGMLVDLLDRVPGGVIVLDRDGRPILMNSAAQAIIAAGDGLKSEPDGLTASHPREAAALRKLIGEALALATERSHAACNTVRLSRPSGRSPLVVWTAPGRTILDQELATSSPHVLLFVSDPEARPQLRLAPAFAKFYGLTPMEGRLVEALVNGATPENAQAIFGISMPTVRKHLQAIFGKTGVNRQTDLVRLVLSSPLQF